MKSGDAPWYGYYPVQGDVPLALNQNLDLDNLAKAYKENNRVQVHDVLTEECAERLHTCLSRETPWGLAYTTDNKPQVLDRDALQTLPPADQHNLINGIIERANRGEYQYSYHCYPILNAYLEGKNPHLYINRWLEFINTEVMLGLIRTITAIPDLKKADAQATLYSRNQFLGLHTDSHRMEGWRIAYVLNLAKNWREDYGGYLLFYDEDGNVTGGFKPKFNTLNLLSVPQRHSVSYVSNFAPVGRFALTGWFRDTI